MNDNEKQSYKILIFSKNFPNRKNPFNGKKYDSITTNYDIVLTLLILKNTLKNENISFNNQNTTSYKSDFYQNPNFFLRLLLPFLWHSFGNIVKQSTKKQFAVSDCFI